MSSSTIPAHPLYRAASVSFMPPRWSPARRGSARWTRLPVRLRLSQTSRNILREINAQLFRTNMRIIRDLLFNWREPGSPAASTGAIGRFDIDVQMVEFERSHVERYIQANAARFTPAVTAEINGTMDPNAFGQSLNPSGPPIQWAQQALGVTSPDFTRREHRIAIGLADIHIFHRRAPQQYVQYMQRRRPTAPRAPRAVPAVPAAP